MASMTAEAREAFLAQTRIGIFSTVDEDGAPISIPIWFAWDGRCIRMFTGASTPKMRRLQCDPRASLLVASELGTPEEWVAIDGTVTMQSEGAMELAERLAERYWDVNDPPHAKTLQLWRDQSSTLRLLELVPSRIRSYTA